MNTISELLAADSLTLGTYNNCFVLSGICKKDNGKKIKQCYFIEDREVKKLWVKGTPENIQYRQLSYANAIQTLEDYFTNGKRQSGDDSLRVSIWLENAKWNNLSLFCIDFDEYDENSKFFSTAFSLADKVTCSQSGGYHMWYGIDRQKAQPLFDSINLTTREGTKSFVCNVANVADGNKVDLFCDSGHLIHEYEKWDNNTGLADKTEELFALLSSYFTFKEKRSVNYWQDVEGKHIQIEGISEDELLGRMTDTQQLVFDDLKTKSPDCTQKEWYRIGVDIKHVFGEELGGSVFLWWSREGQTFQAESLANTWDDICNNENALWNSKWAEIIEVNAFDIAIPKKEERRKQAVAANNEYQSFFDKIAQQEREYNALAAKGQFIFDGLLIQRQEKSISFLLPNENNAKITAYGIIQRLTGNAFKSYRQQEKFTNEKIQLLPYSERYKIVFDFRLQHKPPPILPNADTIAAFINAARKYTNNWELEQQWIACLEATNTQEAAASLLAYYGWAADFEDEYPRTENVFYTVDVRSGRRHYNIVNDDITLRLAAIECKGHSIEAQEIIADKALQHDDKKDKLQALFMPLLWWKKGVKMGLNTDTRLQCEARINEYIDSLLSYNAFDNIPLEKHISNIEIDKSDTGITWATPQEFTIRIEDMVFDDYQYNITAEYNKDNAAMLGQARSRKAAEKKFKDITGDNWTTKELNDLGFDSNRITRLIKNKVIRRVKKGFYERLKK